jgi:enterobacteria phage integrase
MPRKLPPFVETWRDRHGKRRTYGRPSRKSPRIPLPEIGTEEFKQAYANMMAGELVSPPKRTPVPTHGTIAALIVSYMQSASYVGLRETTKRGYGSRLEVLRIEHGHRTVSGLSRERILTGILQPYANRPGAALSILKMLRILIGHAIGIGWLKQDPSVGIERPKTKEIRAWADDEIRRFEAHWPVGTKQRTAYALMLYLGAARTDVHLMTWTQIDADTAGYIRRKTGVSVEIGIHTELERALAAAPRDHVTILNTEYGQPFTANGFSGFMRDAIRAAGLPLTCKPHGLRKTLGRRAWPMRDARPTRSWPRSVTRHSPKLSAIPGKRTGAAAVVKPSSSWKHIARTELPKPFPAVWVSHRKRKEFQSE